MQDPLHPLTDQERFTKDLIAAYKEQSVLWDKNHPQYRNRAVRGDALDAMLQKCRDYYPEADEDFVKMKIDSLRSSFRKEWNKVCFSKASAKKPDDVYRPSLWYYNLLLFTVGEKCSENIEATDTLRVFWPREYTTMLIGLIKKHPCLYVCHPVPTLAKRNAAIKEVTNEMRAYTGKKFTTDNIRRKIQLLKGQYRFECKKVRDRRKNNPKHPYKSNLWCFDMLNFLKGHVFQKSKLMKNDCRKFLRRNRDQLDGAIKSKIEEIDDIKEEAYSEEHEAVENYTSSVAPVIEQEFVNDDYDDIFDTIGKNVAHKLRDMTDDQRTYAQKLINELMYHGLMENLTESSLLNLNVDQ